MVKKVDHVNVVVKNMDESVKFYTELLGFKVSMDTILDGEWFCMVTGFSEAKARCVFLETLEGGTRIELLEYKNPEGVAGLDVALNRIGVGHIALEVDNIEEVVKNAKSIGIEFFSNIVNVPLSIVPKGKKLCYLKAPDGVVVELAQHGEG